jgi:hypothetical protein
VEDNKRGNLAPGDEGNGHAYLESLYADGLLTPSLLKIYVASIILGRAADRIFDTEHLRTLGISNREFESLITMFVWVPSTGNQALSPISLGCRRPG